MKQSDYIQLVFKLLVHTHLYESGDPVLADDYFDRFYKQLERYEAENPDLAVSYSPTQMVGYDYRCLREALIAVDNIEEENHS